eukprot:1158211-Rhodomonas_salina.1
MGGARTMKVVTGKMSGNQGMWGVHTDYPDCVHVVHDGAQRDSTVFPGESLTMYQAVHLLDMLQLVTECFQLAPDSTSWSCSKERIVTEQCDKLSAQEKFIGDNVMSKQASFHECCSQRLQTLTRVGENGDLTWGALCHAGHWGPTVNPPRDFSADNYGKDMYTTCHIPADSPMPLSIKGTVKLKDFEWLLDNLPNWKSPGDDLIPNELLKAVHPWLLNELYAAVNLVLCSGKLLSCWKYAIIKLLEKKAPAFSMSNQCPVCCAQTVYKLVSYFVTSRMTLMLEHYKVLEATQEGFRTARSCQLQAARYVDII